MWPTWGSACPGTSARPRAGAWAPPATAGSMTAAASVWAVSASTTASMRAGSDGEPKWAQTVNECFKML